MKIALSAVVLFLAAAQFATVASASSATYIEANTDAQMVPSQQTAKLMRLLVSGESANRLFDALKVDGVPATEDVLVINKSESGIYCWSETAPAGRATTCEMEINTTDGLIGAIESPSKSADLTVSIHDGAARDLYKALDVSASQDDAEGYTFTKSVPGIMCEKHTLTKTHDCVIIFDSSKGILK